MQEEMTAIIAMAEEAEELLVTSGKFTRGLEEEAVTPQKMATLRFVREAKKQASEGELLPSIEGQIERMVNSYEMLPPSEREPALRCVASLKACMAEANSIADKVLCGIALATCFAKEVIPLA